LKVTVLVGSCISLIRGVAFVFLAWNIRCLLQEIKTVFQTLKGKQCVI